MATDRMTCWSCCARRRPTQTSTFLREGLRVLMQAVMEAEVIKPEPGPALASAARSGYTPATAAGPEGAGGRLLPQPTVGRRTVSLPVAGRADPEGPPRRTDRQRERRGGHRGQP